MNSTKHFLRTSLSLSVAGLLAGLLASACDLPDKNLGDDPPGGTDGGVCMDGDMEMQDCNTCTCESGAWSCTEIACGGSTGGSGGEVCDPADLPPVDDCNECFCEDGEWLCTALGCPSDSSGGSEDTGMGDTGPEECDPADLPPVEDCNECVCIDGGWACTEQACPASPPVTVCEGGEPMDPASITNAQIVGDELILSVEYSGGCAVHEFGSCWDGLFAESEPVQTGLTLNHEDNDDPCDGILMEDVTFSLTPMRNEWIASYQQLSGTITINIDGWGSLDYSF